MSTPSVCHQSHMPYKSYGDHSLLASGDLEGCYSRRQAARRQATDRTQGFQFANIYIAWAKVMFQHVIGGARERCSAGCLGRDPSATRLRNRHRHPKAVEVMSANPGSEIFRHVVTDARTGAVRALSAVTTPGTLLPPHSVVPRLGFVDQLADPATPPA